MFIRELNQSECFQLLERVHYGRLACARDNQPYIVPFCFVCEGNSLLGFTTLGKKVEWMRANPLVCVEVDEIKASDQWTSVVASGHYEELPEASNWKQEFVRAHELLRRNLGWWAPAWADRAGGATDRDFIFYRINLENVTGREARPGNA